MSEKTSEQLKYCKDLHQWPEKWMMLDEDLDYGKQLTEEFEPFVLFLINKNYTKKTIKRHCDNLWLLGSEIISLLNRDDDLRKIPPKKLLGDSIDELGGPYSSHLESEDEEKHFDSTCKKLHKFMSTNK